jgi:hypothetical protein
MWKVEGGKWKVERGKTKEGFAATICLEDLDDEYIAANNEHDAEASVFLFWGRLFRDSIDVPILLYYGYCWGRWGRQSLLLQYLFQCKCPPHREEARYPEAVDVLVSACLESWVELSPSGRLLSVREKDAGFVSTYIFDLQTGEKIPMPLPKGGFNYLSDSLSYVQFTYEEIYIFDRTTGDQYLLRRFSALRPDAMEGGNANPILLAETLQRAKFVFFREYDGTIIALDPDFPASSENNVLIERFDIPGEDFYRTEQFLKENKIVCKTFLPDLSVGALSPEQ